MPVEALQVTPHALDRFRVHHPDATPSDLLLALHYGEPVEPSLALTLVGRPGRPTTSSYVLAPDRRGLFAIQDGRVVTYLRFQRNQREFCIAHWPLRSAVTSSAVDETGGCSAAPETAPVTAQPAPSPPRDTPPREPEGDPALATYALHLAAIDPALRAGRSVAQVRRLVANGRKVEATFDLATWTETVTIELPDGSLVRAVVPYGQTVRIVPHDGA